MEKVIKQFKFLGLSEKEAKIYLTSLEIGQVTIAVLARKAGVKRPTAYHTTQVLIDKVLKLKVPYGRRILYRAESPKKLIELFRQQEEVLGLLVPHLEAKHRSLFHLPKITFYEGKEGIKGVYESFLSTQKTVYALFSVDDFYTLFTEQENKAFLDILRESGGYLIEDEAIAKAQRMLLQSFWKQAV